MKNLKKNVLKDIEKIKEKRNLSKEAKNKIVARVISNWAICISIAILIMTFVMVSKLLAKSDAIFVYNVCSIAFLIFAIVIFEVAYKKDSGTWAVCGIETLTLSILVLFSPYIFFKAQDKYIYILLILITIYYISKIIKITYSEKKKYLLEVSDIQNIVKKESKDELAQDFQIEREEQIEKMQQEKMQNIELKKQVDTAERTAKKTKKTDTTKKTNTASKTKPATKRTSTASKTKQATKKTSTVNKEKQATKKTNTESKAKQATKRKSTTNKVNTDNITTTTKRGRPRKINTEDIKTEKESK